MLETKVRRNVVVKKNFAVLLIISLLISVLPAAAFAGEQPAGAITLEKAIEIAKGFFQIPKEYDQFDSSYEQNEFSDVWSLRWYPGKNNEGTYGEVNVRIDATTGEVAGYSYYSSKDYQGEISSLPKITKKEGEKIALDFIKKVAPSKADEIVLKPNQQIYYGAPVFHSYQFNRVINGIEYPANNINMEINGQTGEVRNFWVNWENLSAAPAKAKLSPSDAQKIFNDKFGIELRYFKPYSENRIPKQVKLIYEIVNPYQVNIDALTGEIIREEMYYPYFKEMYDMGGAGGAYPAESKLEPYEQKAVDELKDVISKEEALSIAEKAIDLPSTFKLRGAQLFRDWEFPELKIWSFNWNVEEKDHYGWASVEVDAKTGKVLAFDFNEDYAKPVSEGQKTEQKPLVIKTREEAEKVVQNYLKENFPAVVDNLRPQQDFDYELRLKFGDAPEKELPSYYFRYERVVDGIPFANNYVNATVNSYTGKLSNFRIRFLDVEFPQKDNVLDKAKFTEDFFAKNPMNLVYIKDRDRNLRLVYKLAPIESFRFDAVTGQKLGWNGEPLKEKANPEITDIQGHWAAKDIETLNELGMLTVNDGLFKPEAEISQAELMKMLVKINNGYLSDATEGNWYDPYYRRAKEMGLILEKEVNPTAAVTREEMAKFLTRMLIWDKVATLDIYKLNNYKDVDKISKGYLGYVAIASELELMTGDGSNWNPQTKVKKGEASVITVRFMKLEKNRVY